MNILLLLKFVLIQTLGVSIAFIGGLFILFLIAKKLHSIKIFVASTIVIISTVSVYFASNGLPASFEFPFLARTFGPANGPSISFGKMIEFLLKGNDMESVTDIARNPNDIPAPITRTEPATVRIELETKEVIGEMADGVSFNYWTFNGTVPGPFLRVREGDTVELTLKNNPTSLHHHNIDLHAVTGPGGGAAVTLVAPGESKTFSFKALNPGLYVYHCAHPNVATHMAHGMYGLILVEPEGGLPEVDKEYYIMQGEFYSTGGLGKSGLQIFDAQKMLDGDAEYIVFNGRTGALEENMSAHVNDTIRLFVGNGGVNLISSFHVIGEIFDRVYPEAAIGSEPFRNVQTTAVPAGGASITEFGLEVPGKFILVDHALARLDRGAWGVLDVIGQDNPEVFYGEKNTNHSHE